jgi:alkanesulfonate monooxygenase SsuD/methylene tetrahydromethanopterin reductase-like flavin-dependent oxidoreductase (luciferase family)
MSKKITININVLTLDRLFDGNLRQYVEQARAIEDAGIDGIVMPDHVVFGSDAIYPFGGWPINPADSWPEPMTVLAAVAGATRSVDLITNVLIAPLRSAALLAKQVATLQGLSAARFQLGVGTGWQKQEYEASGLSFAQRSDFLFDQMRACQNLWQQQPASFHSEHVNFDNIWCAPGLPKRIDGSSLQLWFGLAPIAANARFFAEFNAGWSCIHPDLQFITKGRTALQTALQQQFSATRTLRVRAAPAIQFGADGNPCIDRTIENLPNCIAAGVTEFDFPLMFFVRDAAQFEPFIKKLGRIDRSALEAVL